MKKTYFEAPALELVKVQSMQMLAESGPTVPSEGGTGDDGESDSKAYQWTVLEDDTEE